MGSFKEDVFFDAYEIFDDMLFDSEDCSTSGFGYDYWGVVGNMESVDFRRNKLLGFMGLSSRWLVQRDRDRDRDEDCVDDFVGEIRQDSNVVFDGKIGDASLGNLSRQPSLSDWSSKGVNLVVKTGNRDDSGEDLVKRSFDFSTEGLMESKGDLGSSRKEGGTVSLLDRRRKKVKKGWLQKLNVISRIADRHEESVSLKSGQGHAGTRSVHVHSHKKKTKELSSLYATQEFPAHDGSITTIKFSHDGRYLASAGEDSIVHIWEIGDDQDPRIYEIQGTDPSSFYFSTNQLSELAPIKVDKGKTHKIKGLRKSSELACVILPPKVFRILEKPVHDFHGHGGEILSISWSRRGYLLSASVDKTVRMWKLGHHECLKIFTHTNYDGKVRIWDVHSCQVIDWIDLGDIVTAVCYNPDGKGSIVGTLDGKCSFYDIIGNRSSGSQMSACFTSDGKHIISAADDSNVYVWNHISPDKLITKPKSNASYENFLSQNATMAIPWCAGHVGGPFSNDSKKKPRVVDGDCILGESIVLLGRAILLLLLFNEDLGDGSAAAMLLIPHQGIAIVAFCDKKFSYDALLLGLVISLSGLM
nr:hypothetical protein [Tanacetum cinerariifolium]